MTQKKKKIVTGVVAATVAASIALTGTYAWWTTQSALNAFEENVSQGGQLHDDFDGANKDVYVENTGTTKIYVRVKLQEFLQQKDNNGVAKVTLPTGATQGRYDTYETHIPDADEFKTCDGGFHDYYTWTMGGTKKYIPASEYKGAADPTKDYEKNSDGIAPNDGTYITADGAIKDTRKEGLYKEDDKATESTISPTELGVINIADYTDGYVGWVYDTDGWAYWSEPLAPNTATSLLLNRVDLTAEVDEDTYYDINVVMEAITASQKDKWATGLTDVLDEGKPGNTTKHNVDQASEDAMDILFGDQEVTPTLTVSKKTFTFDKDATAAKVNAQLATSKVVLTNPDGSKLEGTLSNLPAGVTMAPANVSTSTPGTQTYTLTGPNDTTATFTVTVNAPAVTVNAITSISYSGTHTAGQPLNPANVTINFTKSDGSNGTCTGATAAANGITFTAPTTLAKGSNVATASVTGSSKAVDVVATSTGTVDITIDDPYSTNLTADQKAQIIWAQLEEDNTLHYQFGDPTLGQTGTLEDAYARVEKTAFTSADAKVTGTGIIDKGSYILVYGLPDSLPGNNTLNAPETLTVTATVSSDSANVSTTTCAITVSYNWLG